MKAKTKTRSAADDVLDLHEIRQAVADYMYSEGCSCCRNYEAHKINEARLGKLLRVKKYSDGSGYKFDKYQSKEDGE